MNPLDKLFGTDTPDEESERIPIDDLSGEQTQTAIDYLELLDQEATRRNIEWAAYQLQSDELPLVSAVESLEERENLDKKLVAPRAMDRHPEFQVRDERLSQILTVTGFPRKVGLGWLVPLTLADVNLRLSLHINPRDPAKVRKQLQRRYTQTTTALTLKSRKGRTDTHQDELERDDLLRILQDVIRGTTKIYDIAIYIELVADSRDELEAMRERVDSILAEQDVETTVLRHQQIDANGSIVPLATDTIKNVHPIQLEALGTLFNLVEPPIYDDEGILLGFDDTSRPVILDRYAHSGFGAVISGKTGSGKSYARKLEIYRRLLAEPDVQCVLFDPAGDDYPFFAEKLGGEVIRFGGAQKVNPMDIEPPAEGVGASEDTYPLTVRSVVEMLNTHYEERGGLPAAEEGMAIQAAHYAYLSKGIVLGDYDTYANESPIIDDLIRGVQVISAGGLFEAVEKGVASPAEIGHFQELGVLSEDGEPITDTPVSVPKAVFTPSDTHREVAQALEPKFESFKPGGINHNLNGQTNLDLNSRLVVMDMSSFADTGEMPLILHSMLQWAYLEAKRSPSRFDVTFDEAHYLLGRASTRDLINLFIRHARHYDAGLTLMSQTAHEFLRTEERREVYENCDIKMLFYAQSVADVTKEYFDLSPAEVKFLQSAPRGQESGYSGCLLSTTRHGRRRLEVHSGEFEHHVIDNNLDPWEHIEKTENVIRPDHTSDSTPDLTDMPEVANRDLDIELSGKFAQQFDDLGTPSSGSDSSEAPVSGDR
ncbi:hypothetical protein C475_22274 [Halosimplex carlsbadense 2-9-1]|uniref:Helicase HerA central domain-containing protein n=1 Tax=Halosimplex carlsbadense 2-9-1 TaxID=797114 RepID=M0CAR9_9EURY|nr:hypothetical protein [Halosimplex carlsbadense]ELZ19718.1 hypothetical protein C475_22274 [Halosimplex carlsbadense 2-9-1]